MNVEEIKKQCIFCHIVAGRVASKKVYEDSKTSAVLDINPANPGHILLLPKEHYSIMPQIPDDEIGNIGMMMKALSASLLRALKCHGTTLFIANGVAAGQRAQHFMAHIIPRMENDGVGIELQEKKITQEKLNEIKNALLPSVKKALGKSAEPSIIENKTSEKESEKKDKKKSEGIDLDEIAGLLGK